MTADTTKAAGIQLVSDQLQKTSAKWKQLPVKEPTDLKIWNVVDLLFSDILLLRNKGYQWEDICYLIESDFKIKISLFTLQNYFRDIQRTKKARKGKKKFSTAIEPATTTTRSSKKQPESKQQPKAPETEVSPAEITTILDAQLSSTISPMEVKIQSELVKEDSIKSEGGIQDFEQMINQASFEDSSSSRTKRKSRFND